MCAKQVIVVLTGLNKSWISCFFWTTLNSAKTIVNNISNVLMYKIFDRTVLCIIRNIFWNYKKE